MLLTDKDGRLIVPLIVIGLVGYSTYRSWDNFLDRSQQTESNLSGYYEFRFEDPEWQRKYENYNPARDYQLTLATGVYAGANTPGTSLSGPPPGIAGSIGIPSLITIISKRVINLLVGFRAPPNYQPGQVLGNSTMDSRNISTMPPSNNK